jgi:hypothetical protein
LHINCHVWFRRWLQVQEAMATILDTMPKGGGGGGGLSREDIVDQICQDLLSKVSASAPYLQACFVSLCQWARTMIRSNIGITRQQPSHFHDRQQCCQKLLALHSSLSLS